MPCSDGELPSGFGLQFLKPARKPALPPGSGIAVNGAGRRDLVQKTRGFAELRLSGIHILIVDSREEFLHLILDPTATPQIAGVLDGVLTHTLLG